MMSAASSCFSTRAPSCSTIALYSWLPSWEAWRRSISRLMRSSNCSLSIVIDFYQLNHGVVKMAQSALTVTPPSPTPPTNMSFTGATPPNPPNFTKLTYADWLDNTRFDTNPPPYFDDGAAGGLFAFATNTAALASGSGGTAGGTEGSYPGAAA